jgi:hypothetical protein
MYTILILIRAVIFLQINYFSGLLIYEKSMKVIQVLKSYFEFFMNNIIKSNLFSND